MNYHTINLFGYKIFVDSLNKINPKPNHRLVINTLNTHSYVVAKKDIKFKEALLASDVLIPDGIGMVKAIKYLNQKIINRITGYDLLIYSLNYLNKSNGKCFFMGSTNTVLISIKKRIIREYKNIEVGYYSPPFKSEFTNKDDKNIIDSINKFRPDILFIGMTAPKQEKWVYLNKNNLDAKAICSIGAVFDYYAGTVNRPSLFWREKGFEWLVRFFKNPLKLWQRNLISMPIFIFDIIRYKNRIS